MKLFKYLVWLTEGWCISLVYVYTIALLKPKWIDLKEWVVIPLEISQWFWESHFMKLIITFMMCLLLCVYEWLRNIKEKLSSKSRVKIVNKYCFYFRGVVCLHIDLRWTSHEGLYVFASTLNFILNVTLKNAKYRVVSLARVTSLTRDSTYPNLTSGCYVCFSVSDLSVYKHFNAQSRLSPTYVSLY